MIVAEVGEHDRVELGSVDSVHCQRVRRHLDHHRGLARVDELAQHGLQLGRLRRGAWAVERADDTAGMPAPSKIDASSAAVVVLPFVPVTPTVASDRLG